MFRNDIMYVEHIKSDYLVSSSRFSTISMSLCIFSLLFGSGILILLVLRHEIVHVGLGFSKFHFIHALTSVPVPETHEMYT